MSVSTGSNFPCWRAKPSSHSAKTGPARLRKALYFPAIAAVRFNPVIHALSVRLRAAGKPKMVVLGAAMRKLIHLAYGVLKSGLPFCPELRPA